MNRHFVFILITAVILSTEVSEAIIVGDDDLDNDLVDSYAFPSRTPYVKEIPAREILEKIESGKPVNYEHVIINGDISLNQSNIPKIYINNWYMFYIYKDPWLGDWRYNLTEIPGNFILITSLIKINDCFINGSIDFDNVIFHAQNISFNNTRIRGNASFTNSSFNGSAYFVNTDFNRSVSFRDSAFMNSAFFVYTAFDGSADFIGTGFHGFASFWSSRFNQSADFRGAKFYERANFIFTEFLKDVDFEWARFDKMANFQAPKFNGSANFKDTWFNDYALFGGTFNGDVNFESFFNETASIGSIFNGDARFDWFNGDAYFRSYFNGNVTFNGFNGTADFNETRFNKDAYFSDWDWFWHKPNNFNGDAFFKYSIFNGSAIFHFLWFNGTSDFTASEFKQDADFVGSRFNRSADFTSSSFKGFADFSGTQFNKSAFFNYSEINSSASFDWCRCNDSFYLSRSKVNEYLSFEGADLSIANFNWAKLSGDLFLESCKIGLLNLTRTEYRNIFLKWKDVDHMDYDETTYLLLISNLKRVNFIDDANQFYYRYRNDRRATLTPLYKPVDYILMLFYGYGLKPERPVICAFVFMALFAILFYWGQGITPVREGEPESEANRFTPLEAMAFSGMTFLSGGKLVFDPPEYRITPGRPWRDVQICKALFVWERLMGMILIVMFAIAVSKTIILGS